VVLGIGADGSRPAVLLQPTENMHIPLLSGYGPVTHLRVGITHVRRVAPGHFRSDVRRTNIGIIVQIGQLESTGTVGHKGIGEQHHRRHVLQSHLRGIIGRIEAVRRRSGCNDRHRRFAVASEKGLQQIRLLALRGQARGRASALHVQYHQRQFRNHGQIHGFRFQTYAGPRSRSHCQCTGKGSTDGRGTTGNLVLALYCGHAQTFMFGQFMQHVRSRRNGIRPQEKPLAGFLSRSDKSVCSSLIAHDVHILTGLFRLGFHFISMGHRGMRICPVIISGLDNLYIGFCHGGLFGKFLTQHIERYLQVAVEQPAHQSERKHVTAFQNSFVVHARVSQTGFDHLGDRSSNHIVFDAQLLYRIIRRESGLLQIFGLETIGVDNNTCCRFGISVLGL